MSPLAYAQQAKLTLKKGDHICLIGNTLAERMQHFGHFETLLHAEFPELQLVMRNLGFSGDEIAFRPRSLNFGTPDEHLTANRADVILAFFGFSESFDGVEGLGKFEADLDLFIQNTLAQKYNGHSAPRLALISPIAHEDLGNPNLPDGSQHNSNLELYTQAMAKIAAKHGVVFVDLFHVTGEMMRAADEPMTFNGVHLTDSGYRRLAPVLMELLFGKKPSIPANYEAIRAEVNEKCWQWFHRYRAVNGFYIYGGRSQRDHSNPPYTDAYVIGNELKKIEEMTALRDERIWTVAGGGKVPEKIDDSKTRPLYDVPTNFTQPIVILPPEEAIKHFTVAEGYAVNCFASEVDFPDMQNPVQLSFDLKGRLWVSTMPSYPQYQPPNKPNDKLLILEDTDGDGKADKQTVFADGLHLPTGFEFGDGGVYVAQQPDLWFLKDTDGDDRADVRVRVLHGFDSADSHHSISAFVWGPGGGLYMHEGTFHHTSVETPYGTIRNAHGGIYRYDPVRQLTETFVHYNFANPWGHCFDRWGQNFVADASGGANYFGTAFSTKAPQFEGQEDFGPFMYAYQEQMQQFFPKRVRPTAGCAIVASRHFPPEAQGNYLLNNCIGFQGVLQHTMKEEGSGFVGKEVEPILFSSDMNFRPVDIEFGPDGALYIVDWFNPLVGHMQHSLRDPNRDHTHGRVWRITYPSRPLLTPPQIEGQPLEKLLDLLKEYEERTRYRTRIKLREFPTDEVVAALDKWVLELDPNDSEYQHHLLEALWVKQHHNAVDQDLLGRLLRSPDHRARAAATRVLCFWRDYISDALNLLRVQANDEHPRVRLEAVRACSFFEEPLAAEVALDVLKHPTDYYIDYTLRHTIRRLEKYWKPAVGSGRPFAANNPAAIEYIIGRLEASDLINMTRSEPVYRELLSRHGVVPQYRQEALEGLAKLHKSDVVAELLAAVTRLDQATSEHAGHVLADMAYLFTQQKPQELARYREQIQKLSTEGKRPITRQVSYVALLTADGSPTRVWDLASQSVGSLRDLVDAVPLIPSPEVRATLYDYVAPLIHKLPDPLEESLKDMKGVAGRFVRIELPGQRRTLTLAEVQVMSGRRNLALGANASQSTTSNGGVASRAVDGNTNGEWSSGTLTHTVENQANPWWEVDLGSEQPIDSVTVWNRRDGNLGKRLDGFVLKILDSNREVVFEKKGNPAPTQSVAFQMVGDPRMNLRRSAIAAVSFIPNRDSQTFELLVPFVTQPSYRNTAIQALGRLKRSELPKDKVGKVVEELVSYVESVPAKQRTQTDVVDAIQLGKDLAVLLPREQALSIREKLSDLAVDVIVIRPIPHRMQYDRNDIYVRAGRPVEIVFLNTDIMPHNLVLTKPGAREEVGILAEKLGASPRGFELQFIPDTDKVLAATKMLQPEQQERLQLTAPSEVGEYPYVCTFPGHWRTMYGTMHVVKSLSDIPLESPEPQGEQMPTRQFVRKWSVDDLLAAVSELESANRSLAKGEKLFVELSCIKCHQLQKVGGNVGPDLVDVRTKFAKGEMDAKALFTELVAPSQVIAEKFRTNIVVNDEGVPFSGVVIHEDDKVLKLASNPLEKDAKVSEIDKDTIEERVESKVSLMPEGLLDTMTRDEIFDLLAYILRGGPPKASATDAPAASQNHGHSSH